MSVGKGTSHVNLRELGDGVVVVGNSSLGFNLQRKLLTVTPLVCSHPLHGQ